MSATKLKVMLVEDDDFTRSTVKSALEGQGLNIVYDTAFVKDGVEFAKKNRPDVAVLDYNLGKGPNGIDLANQLRRMQPSIGIVLLTAFLNPAELDTKIAQLPAGSRYLVKHSVSNIKVLVKEIAESAKHKA
ncbi:MAG: response regulator [Actinobacteria bacterium]|jgi:CheY-like chemotaxis protein|nr:response regulator [Actinomycetota bacterium]